MSAVSVSAPSRFLLRGSILTVVLLTIWWLLLLNPLVILLRSAVEFCGALLPGQTALTVTNNANGDWTFEVPVEATLPVSAANPAPQQIHSIDFDLVRSDANGFTFGLPVFWAIILAARDFRRHLRALVLGTAITVAAEVALVLLTAETLAHRSLAQLLDSHDPFMTWFWKFGDYLTVNAIPYVLPFAVSIFVHRGLRQQIFGWDPAKVSEAPRTKTKAKAARQSRGQSLPG